MDFTGTFIKIRKTLHPRDQKARVLSPLPGTAIMWQAVFRFNAVHTELHQVCAEFPSPFRISNYQVMTVRYGNDERFN